MPRLTPSIELVLDKPRYLRMDKLAIFAAERDMCRVWGKQVNIIWIFADVQSLTLNDLSILLHRALLDDDPTLKLEQVQTLMDFDKLPAILEALFAAWNAATAPANPQEVNGTDAPLAFPGVPSGPSPVLS